MEQTILMVFPAAMIFIFVTADCIISHAEHFFKRSARHTYGCADYKTRFRLAIKYLFCSVKPNLNFCKYSGEPRRHHPL